jgi:hypothetical protein
VARWSPDATETTNTFVEFVTVTYNEMKEIKKKTIEEICVYIKESTNEQPKKKKKDLLLNQILDYRVEQHYKDLEKNTIHTLKAIYSEQKQKTKDVLFPSHFNEFKIMYQAHNMRNGIKGFNKENRIAKIRSLAKYAIQFAVDKGMEISFGQQSEIKKEEVNKKRKRIETENNDHVEPPSKIVSQSLSLESTKFQMKEYLGKLLDAKDKNEVINIWKSYLDRLRKQLLFHLDNEENNVLLLLEKNPSDIMQYCGTVWDEKHELFDNIDRIHERAADRIKKLTK